MLVVTSDYKQSVDIGSYTIWHALYSTVVSQPNEVKCRFPDAISFFQSGRCNVDSAERTANQLNLVRDCLSLVSPDKAVYDIDNPQIDATWKNSISSIVTSCANLFTTADGKDLLYELVRLLSYASKAKVSIEVTG